MIPKYLLTRIIEEAAKLADMPTESVQVVLAEAVTWPNGGLGCPEAGMLYSEQLVEGYWVQLEIAGERFDYRATMRGRFRRCLANDALPGSPSDRI